MDIGKILSEKPEYCHYLRMWKIRYLSNLGDPIYEMFDRYVDALSFIKEHKYDIVRDVWGLHHNINQ